MAITWHCNSCRSSSHPPGSLQVQKLSSMNISLKEKAHSHKTTRVGQGWCMPRQILRFGDQLMQQQLWCWGRDVERAEGNLLMEFGFERHRDCAIDPQSTCYRLDCDELHVSLWGFGMFFGRRDLGGCLLYTSPSPRDKRQSRMPSSA